MSAVIETEDAPGAVWKKCQHPRTPENTTTSGRCRTCAREHGKRWARANAEKNRDRVRQHYLKNRDKRIAYTREYQRKNPERHRASATICGWRDQGIRNRAAGQPFSWADYNELLAMQSGACLLCGRVPGASEKRLVPDHDHATGICRALVCHTCNTIEGMMAKRGINATEFAHRLLVLRVVPAVFGKAASR